MKLSDRIADKPLVDENEIETGSYEITEEELGEIVQLEAENNRLHEEINGWIRAMKLIEDGNDRGAAVARSALQDIGFGGER